MEAKTFRGWEVYVTVTNLTDARDNSADNLALEVLVWSRCRDGETNGFVEESFGLRFAQQILDDRETLAIVREMVMLKSVRRLVCDSTRLHVVSIRGKPAQLQLGLPSRPRTMNFYDSEL